MCDYFTLRAKASFDHGFTENLKYSMHEGTRKVNYFNGHFLNPIIQFFVLTCRIWPCQKNLATLGHLLVDLGQKLDFYVFLEFLINNLFLGNW